MKKQIIPNTEPFYFPGNRTGCILVHGFTGAPTEMQWLGEFLNQQGFTVVGVRLTGHGTKVEDMIRSRWQDWAASVEDAWHMLQNTTDKIFIIGLSMGGVLSLNHALNFPVKGLVVMSTPLDMPQKNFNKLRGLALAISKIIPSRKKASGSGWFTPEAAIGHISYPRNPYRSIVELSYLIDEVNHQIKMIKAPTLVIHSKDDKYVLPYNAELIFNKLTCEEKELMFIEDAGHVITRDGDKEIVFNKIVEFIKKFS